MLLLVADRFLLLGMIMAVICLVSWVTVPVGRFIHYLAASPRLHRVRTRAIAVTAGLALVLVVLLVLVPFPNHFRAPGVVQARQRTEVANDVAGRVEAILIEPGTRVVRGQPLVRLASRQLELELADALGRHEEAEDRLREALSRSAADLKPMQSRLASAEADLAKLRRDESLLMLRAPQDGTWVAPRIEETVGEYIVRGTPLGIVIDPKDFEFVATVVQADADAVFASAVAGRGRRVQARRKCGLRGQAGATVPVRRMDMSSPAASSSVSSPALGWAAGGDLPVTNNKPDQATEPFFEVHAALAPTGVTLVHGRSGAIRFDLPPEPLLPRWWRRLRQLLQKRYQV